MEKNLVTTALLAALRNTTGHVINIIIANENIPMDFLYSDEFLVWNRLSEINLKINELAFTKEYEEFALDCLLLDKVLVTFTNSLHTINEKYKNLLEHIKSEFKNSGDHENDTSTALPILKAQKEIKKYLNSDHLVDFDNYIFEISQSLKILKINFLTTKLIKHQIDY